MTQPPKTCGEIMSKTMVTLCEEDNLEHVAEAMADFNIRHVPVVDGKKLVGMVSQRDVLRLAVSSLTGGAAMSSVERNLAEGTFVAKVMTRNPVTVTPSTPLADAARLLIGHKVGALAVVDEAGLLVGVVSEVDVLRVAESVL